MMFFWQNAPALTNKCCTVHAQTLLRFFINAGAFVNFVTYLQVRFSVRNANVVTRIRNNITMV